MILNYIMELRWALLYWFDESRKNWTLNLKDADQTPNASRPSCGWLIFIRPEWALSSWAFFFCLFVWFFFFFTLFFSLTYISWSLITLQYCSGFCHTLTWISHGFTCVPHPEPPSHLPPHLIPLGHPSAPALSTCLMHQTWTGDLFHSW